MIPRDWMLIKLGHAAQSKSQRPGAAAPSAADVASLVEKYG